MRFKVVALAMCVMFVALAPIQAYAQDVDQFEAAWSMFFPKFTYFIGETVSFNVHAFAAEYPDLALPNHYANIVVRNQSMFEVFNWWVITDENGTASVDWVTQLTYDNGTYTIILTDGMGAIVTAYITLLWDDNTAWQRQMTDLQQEVDFVWQHMDDLYAARNYLLKKNRALTEAIYFLSFMFCITFIAAIWVAAREYIRVNARMDVKSRPGLAGLLGLRAVPFFSQIMDHPEAANYQIPPHHTAPRFGEDYHCPLCDSEGRIKMTKHQWEEHMQDFHERRQIGIKAWVRHRHFKDAIRQLYDKGESEVVFESLLPENIRKEKIVKRAESLRAQMKAGELTKEQARAELDKYRVSLGFAAKWSHPEPVYKESSSQKTEPARKPPQERQLPKKPKTRTLKVY